MPFPAEPIPDTTIQTAHHYYLLIPALLVVFIVWDDYRHKEPLVPVLGIVIGLIGFILMWPNYGWHRIGAIIALVAPTISILSILNPWGTWMAKTSEGGYPWRVGLVAVVLILGALDDAVQHAFGWPTPLDTAFKMYGPKGAVVIAVVVGIMLLISMTGWGRVRKKLGLDLLD